MARRILFVTNTNAIRDLEKELFVDAFVEVERKIGMVIRIRPRGYYPSLFNGYGILGDQYSILTDADEITWLHKAMARPQHDHSDKAIKLLARVNQLGLENAKGEKGFKIEVLTGKDAEYLIAAERRAFAIEFGKDHWWQIGLCLIVAWWWFF